MKFLILLFFIFISSCGYPDIDSVPNFKNLTLSKEEVIDLCKLVNTVNEDFTNCIKEINSKEKK